MLKINHLTKTFGDKTAVDDLTLHIAPGEIYGFIGHNGAGKSTTLRSAAGIQQFDRGEIEVCGISLKDAPLDCKRMMAYIPDNPDLYEYMTGIQYLNFISDVFRMDADTRSRRIRDYADRFQLTSDLAQPVAAYSHGMKQIQIARAGRAAYLAQRQQNLRIFGKTVDRDGVFARNHQFLEYFFPVQQFLNHLRKEGNDHFVCVKL